MIMITEVGLLQGWLWEALKRAGESDQQILIFVTGIVILWHIPAVSLSTSFEPLT